MVDYPYHLSLLLQHSEKSSKLALIWKRVSRQDWGVQYVKRPKLFSQQVQHFLSRLLFSQALVAVQFEYNASSLIHMKPSVKHWWQSSIDGSAIWVQCQFLNTHETLSYTVHAFSTIHVLYKYLMSFWSSVFDQDLICLAIMAALL